MKADAKDLLRRTTRPWRVVFILYALVLTTATHWPSLDVGGESFEAPDKLIHMLAFAALLVLLWRTRWIRRVWQAGVIVLAWTVVDEVTQSLPILDRVFSGQDLAAGQLGVLVTLAWFWALAPIGGPANRARIAWQWFVIDDLYAGPLTWILSGLAGLGGGLLIGSVISLVLRNAGLDSIVNASAVVPSSVLLAGFAGGVAAGLAAVAAAVRRRARVLGEIRPCFSCGSPCREAAIGDDGSGPCPVCGAAFHAAQWSPSMVLPLSVAVRGAGRGALAGVGVLVAAWSGYAAILGLSIHFAPAAWALRAWEGLLPDMRLTVDVSLVCVAVAVAARVYRGRQALLYDRQHLRCRVCGHDLTGTEVRGGCGRCGECGTPFARLNND